jgi:hypothetical protein
VIVYVVDENMNIRQEPIAKAQKMGVVCATREQADRFVRAAAEQRWRNGYRMASPFDASAPMTEEDFEKEFT